jgi:hypothetical protein
MKVQLSYAMRFLMLSATFLVGCRTAHNLAVSSFRVIDAPANYVRRHIDDDEGTTTSTTTTTYQSDVVTPGQPIVTPPPQQSVVTRHRTRTETDEERSEKARDNQEQRPKSTSPQRTASSTTGSKIPYAKPVPGKPGYVYSPFDPNGGYVDVTGYAAGSKAKDPYSGKIFLVP